MMEEPGEAGVRRPADSWWRVIGSSVRMTGWAADRTDSRIISLLKSASRLFVRFSPASSSPLLIFTLSLCLVLQKLRQTVTNEFNEGKRDTRNISDFSFCLLQTAGTVGSLLHQYKLQRQNGGVVGVSQRDGAMGQGGDVLATYHPI